MDEEVKGLKSKILSILALVFIINISAAVFFLFAFIFQGNETT